ncbi:glycosyltransferase family 2 protein [Bacillus piscicola]|uniref:glycosyltransferase family 2 protein n=1 Tax=Bacillus piscicola TaxID=1632684 RepID=UPI001F08B47F|nr:glycosyltransferase family 2 protein [Bacillus piscicola]
MFKYLAKRVASMVPTSMVHYLFQKKGILSPIKLYKSQKAIKKYFGKFRPNIVFDNSDIKVWENAFKKYMWIYPERIELVKSFVNCDIRPVKVNRSKAEGENTILICVVKNDLERIKMLYKHHKNIGINHFVIIDNDSEDRTLEWLCEQTDIDVYLVKEKFTSLKKYGWINRIISMYGFNNWYLYVDSDELFVYEDMENRNISSLIKYAKKNKLNRIGSIMLDMYSDKSVFQTNNNTESIRDEYRFFDSDSYSKEYSYKGLELRGGARKRVMNESNNWEGPLLTKNPLFYLRQGEIFESAHFIFPFEKNTFIGSALLHYKFLESDLNRYKKIAQEGNFAGGSIEYKHYISSFESNPNLNFMYDGSVEYVNSSSLKHVANIMDLKW